MDGICDRKQDVAVPRRPLKPLEDEREEIGRDCDS